MNSNLCCVLLFAGLSVCIAEVDWPVMKMAVCRQAGFEFGSRELSNCLSNVFPFGTSFCLAVSFNLQSNFLLYFSPSQQLQPL